LKGADTIMKDKVIFMITFLNSSLGSTKAKRIFT
jgi:hypothetical protein